MMLSLTAGELVQTLLKDNFKEYKDLRTILNDISFSCQNITSNLNPIPKDGLYLFEQDGNIGKLI